MKRVVSITILAAAVILAPLAGAELTAGAAKRNIVPPFPTHMGGYGDRMETFEGAHDPLFARAVAVDNGATTLVVIGSDLILLDAKFAELVREAIHDRTDIPPEHIMVSATHNHAAPSYYQYESEEKRNRARDFFVEQFAGAAIEAYESRIPAELGYRLGEMKGVTRNRQQDNETAVDTTLGVLRVEAKEGRGIIATVFNFTGHPVILGSDNLQLSGEFPGAACRTVEETLGGVSVFLQGACGDVTVHRSGDPFKEIKRLGRAIAGEVIKQTELIRPDGEAELAGKLATLTLPRRELPSVEEAERAVTDEEQALQQAKDRDAPKHVIEHHEKRLRLFSAELRMARGNVEGGLPLEDEYEADVQVFRMGDTLLASVPGELFVEYGLEMRQRIDQMAGLNTMVVGFANGYIGYIVTPRAMETGGYEASVARVGENAGRRLTETAVDLARAIVSP